VIYGYSLKNNIAMTGFLSTFPAAAGKSWEIEVENFYLIFQEVLLNSATTL
jgi:hypothetical protein